MKITVLTGSPRRKGTTALLADEFIRGAKEAGHDVFRFDAAFEKLSPCIACDKCKDGEHRCIYHDAMEKLNPELIASDVIVFVTPLYYFGISAQLKTVIDRFYLVNDSLRIRTRKAFLLAACADDERRVMDALVSHYETMLDYLKWESTGILLAPSCGEREDIEHTRYPRDAYILGRNL